MDDATTTQHPDPDLERYRIRFGLYKVLAGTALVGALGVIVPGAVEFWQSYLENQRREREVAVTQARLQQDYVRDFLETALNQDIELRLRFAEYFARVSADDYKDDWQSLYDELLKTRDDTRAELHAKEAELRKLLVKEREELSIDEQIRHDQLERELEWRYREIGYVERDRSVVRSAKEQAAAPKPAVAVAGPDDAFGSGYDPEFLGAPPIPMPEIARPTRARGPVRLDYVHHSILYSERQHAPLAVVVAYDGALKRSVRRAIRYQPDPRVAADLQIDTSYSRDNNYDRGNLVTSYYLRWGADDDEAQRSASGAYFYTFVDLMHRNVNIDEWALLETHLRERIGERRAVLLAGPIFDGGSETVQPEGKPARAVPTAFWMIAHIQFDTGREVESFLVPQDETTTADISARRRSSPDDYRVDIAEIERRSGLTFSDLSGR